MAGPIRRCRGLRTPDGPDVPSPMPERRIPMSAKNPQKSDEVVVRVPQIRILKVLARAGTALSSGVIAERAKVAMTAVVGKLGSEDPKDRKSTERRHNYKSLITWGYVKAERI